MTRIKVCHLSTVHSVRDIRIFYKECITLAAAGYDVTYLSQGIHDEVLHGVRRLGTGRPEIMNKLLRMTVGCRRLISRALELDADIYHIHDSELLRFAGKLKKAGKVVVYDSHEHLPMQILEKEWLPKFSRPMISLIAGKSEMKHIRNTDLIVVVADRTYDRFANCRTDLIKLENYPIFREFEEINIDYKLKNQMKTLCYSGAVWLERGLDTMCTAAAGIDNCNFEIAGRIDHESPSEYIKSIGANINYAGYLSRDDVVKLYERSIAGVCLFKPYPNNMIDPPTKIFEYMAAGIPVIASDFDSITGVVGKFRCGICVDPLDIDEIRKAMKYILDNPDEAEKMGHNGRKAVKEIFNWEEHSKVLLDSYKKLLGDKNG